MGSVKRYTCEVLQFNECSPWNNSKNPYVWNDFFSVFHTLTDGTCCERVFFVLGLPVYWNLLIHFGVLYKNGLVTITAVVFAMVWITAFPIALLAVQLEFFSLTQAPKLQCLISTSTTSNVWVRGSISTTEATVKSFLKQTLIHLLVSVISLIDLGKLSLNNGFECSSCGEEKCLYGIFSSWVILSFRNVSKSWLSFHNIKAETAHFFNEAFTSSKSSYGSVNFIPLFKESNKKQIMLWF